MPGPSDSSPRNRRHGKVLWPVLVVIFAGVLFSGCQAVRFYSQAIAGQYQLLTQQKPVRELIQNTNTSLTLKGKLEAVLKIRKFAENELKLPVKNQYLNYVELHRPCVVWNVTAAPALSLEPKTWWFPIVGRASYRGYFSKDGAKKYAASLEKEGWDVYVGGVETYSTLGWFRDPLLSTFINDPEPELADTLFHELAHQKLFVAGDTEFNESFAMAVAEEGVRRWSSAQDKPGVFAQFQKDQRRQQQFIEILLAARQQLAAAYANSGLPDAGKLDRKKQIIAQLRDQIAVLKAQSGGDASFDGWLKGTINNARLDGVSTYHKFIPAFQEMIRASGGSMEKFYQSAKDLSLLPLKKRHAELASLASKSEVH